MDNYNRLLELLAEILCKYELSPTKSDIFERVILIKSGDLPYTALWGKIVPSLKFKNSTDPSKINMIFRGTVDAADALLKFMHDKCDANAVIVHDPDKNRYTLTLDFNLLQTKFLEYFKHLISVMAQDNVPELTPHRFLSEYDPRVLKVRFKRQFGIDNANNPFGLVMKEMDHNLAKLGLSICFTQLLGYSLMLMTGGRNHTFETSDSRTWPIKYIKDPVGIYADRGWGFYYNYGFASPHEYIRFNPEDNGRNVSFETCLKQGADVEKLGGFLQSLCKVKISSHANCYYNMTEGNCMFMDDYAHATFTISTKDYYQKVLPKFKEFITAMTRSEFPELYEIFKQISAPDPDVIRLRNTEDKTWESIPINFPEKTDKPKKPQ